MTQIALTNNFNSLIGQPEDFTKVQQNFEDITTVVNGQLSDDNFSSSAGVYSAYRTIHEAHGRLDNDKAAATYLLTSGGVLVNGAAGITPPSCKYLDDADYAISGRSTKLRVRGVVEANATAPAINFTFGLAPIAVAGGIDAITYSAGAAVAGSTIAVNAPAASTATAGTGSDFTIPADGLYALFVATSGTQANNNFCGLRVELQQRWT